jgi:hypothetical protein
MIEQSGCQVRELLPVSFERMTDTMQDELCKQDGVTRARLAWGFVGSEASSAVRSVLDVDVFELVAHCWCEAKELHEYTDTSRHPPNERAIVHLSEHAFVKVLHPVLEVMVGSIDCGSLRFTLELAANFRAVALTIVSAHIIAVDAGDGFVGAKLKYGDVTLHKAETRKVSFPAHLAFRSPGLAIG